MKRHLFTVLVVLSLLSAARSQDIFQAFRRDDIQAVKALIEKSPQVVNSRDAEGQTPLHYAAYGGDSAVVNFLIDHGAKLEIQDIRAKTPLHIAATNDRKDVVAILLRRGAAVDVRDDYERTALVLCARERGHAATARVLLDAGADVNAADKFGDTALDLAAWRGKGELVDLLLARGATVPASGDKWQSMVSTAASKGLPKLFRLLTQKGQNLKANAALRGSLLYDAARGGEAEIVETLLDQGFDPDSRDTFGWTPLHYAALDGRAEAARKLIENRAPLDARTIAGQTPWNVARERGMTAVAGLLASEGADTGEARFPLLEGDYLGQKPPVENAEVFALGIISSIWGLHSTAVFSPDGNEVYWAPMISYPGEVYSRGGLLMMKRVGSRWTSPAWAPFSGPDSEDDVPFFSVDGKRIYFISQRPIPGTESSDKERIWFTDRTNGGWSTPKPLDPVINEYDMHWEFSLDRERNLYLALRAADGRGMGDIYCARFVDGRYERPVNLGDVINTAADETTPFIAPDGSYLLFSRAFDLWVSFREKDGTWSTPVKFGPEVNSPGFELCPVVSADGKYLFFTSARAAGIHAYWVGADVVKKARPKSH